MTQIVNKNHSIYVQLLYLLTGAAIAAIVFFQIFYSTGNYVLDHYLESSTYIEKQNLKYLAKMQKYVTAEHISSSDIAQLNTWVQRQKMIYVRIYKDQIQIYDSDYPKEDVSVSEIAAGNYPWESYYNLELSDITVEVMISGSFSYQLYNWLLVGSICLSFAVFLGIVLLGIRKKMKYILKLSDEIAILEGGSLDYSITVKGKDELAMLAEGIENMRIAFQSLLNQEMEMMKENQRIVTEMSHDIRTPVTAIMLYSEILQKEQYKTEEQRKEYVKKINKKAYRLKQLVDHLFEYALVAGDEEIELEEPELFETVFFDLFSETCNYLEQKGFTVDFDVEWVEQKISISTDYMIRIMDNVTSNIIKYAEPGEVVSIFSRKEKDRVGILFENRVRLPEEKVESNGIGIQNIKNMMKKMNGECIVEKENQEYRIILVFPYVN